MRKDKSRILVLILTLSLVLTLIPIYSRNAEARHLIKGKLISIEMPKDLYVFVANEFPKHKNALTSAEDKLDFSINKIEKFNLGTPFNVYRDNIDGLIESNIYYFPVMEDKNIVAIFSVGKTGDNNYSATLSKGFADRLNTVLSENPEDTFRIVNVDENLIAINDDKAFTIAEKNNNDKPYELSKFKLKEIRTKEKNYVQSIIKRNHKEMTVNVDSQLITTMSVPVLQLIIVHLMYQ